MATTKVIFYLNDNLFEILGLKNAETDAYINNGVTAITLDLVLKSDGSAITGATGLSLTYRAASNGEWVTTIPDTASISRSAKYLAKITANSGAGLQGYWEIDVQSQVRHK